MPGIKPGMTVENAVTARIIDGKAIAAELRGKVAGEVKRLTAQHGVTPGLAVVLAGNNPASESYVGSKAKATKEAGMQSFDYRLPDGVGQAELMALVKKLNADPAVHGILVQLPLPPQIDAQQVLDAIDPMKDVDGFHPVNAGRLQSGQPGLQPCTPAGIIEILKRSNLPISGQNAVVIGRSDIVGKPVALLLINESATVTVCHSKTRDLPAVTRNADILVAAIGRPGYVTPEMVRPGAILIDVGINRLTDSSDVQRFFAGDAERAAAFAKRGSVIVGDIDPAAFAISRAYTPVPGGVGALTIAMLMHNTVKAARLRRGIATESR